MKAEEREEKMVRLALAAVFIHGALCARQPNAEFNINQNVDDALTLADVLIKKAEK